MPEKKHEENGFDRRIKTARALASGEGIIETLDAEDPSFDRKITNAKQLLRDVRE